MTQDVIRNSDNGTTFVAILNLPAQSSLRLDGQTILLHRDDFVGIAGIPLDGFHLVAVRPSITKANAKNNGGDAGNIRAKEPVFTSITTGFVLPTTNQADGTATPPGLMRRYDPQIEEVSTDPLDELTQSNLQRQIRQGSMDPQRLLPYANIIRSETAAMTWREATSMITLDLLTNRGIPPGSKIIPGSHQDDVVVSDFVNASLQDGNSPRYPDIPVLLEQGRRRTTHRGTRAFLQGLSPTQRTALLTDDDASTKVFRIVLQDIYRGNWRDLLGDVQLAYTLFLNLHCYSSLEHWRDLVALCCRVSPDSVTTQYNAIYTSLVQVLSTQIQSMEGEFFDDMDLSEDNFLVPSLQRLLQTLKQVQDDGIQRATSAFTKLLRDRLPHRFGEDANPPSEDSGVDRMVIDDDEKDDKIGDYDGDDDGDDGGPVIVVEEELQASYQRQMASDGRTGGILERHSPEIRQRFPILFAAQQVHEDIVMTCARALEAATDVSLVREAADYLEQVEARKQDE